MGGGGRQCLSPVKPVSRSPACAASALQDTCHSQQVWRTTITKLPCNSNVHVRNFSAAITPAARPRVTSSDAPDVGHGVPEGKRTVLHCQHSSNMNWFHTTRRLRVGGWVGGCCCGGSTNAQTHALALLCHGGLRDRQPATHSVAHIAAQSCPPNLLRRDDGAPVMITSDREWTTRATWLRGPTITKIPHMSARILVLAVGSAAA